MILIQDNKKKWYKLPDNVYNRNRMEITFVAKVILKVQKNTAHTKWHFYICGDECCKDAIIMDFWVNGWDNLELFDLDKALEYTREIIYN